MKIAIILPTQLFESSNLLGEFTVDDIIIMYEHPVYFTDYNYHKMKLVMHRATMKYYYDYLNKKYKSLIVYLDFDSDYIKVINKYKYESINVYNPYDSKISSEFKKNFKNLVVHSNPGFMCDSDVYKEYLSSEKTNRYINHSFYIWCRKHFNILMNGDKPVGGKWSFDGDNRLPFPKNYADQYLFTPKKNKYIDEAKKYINSNFKKNHGDTDYYLPMSFDESLDQLKKFLKYKLNNFGPYEDATDKNVIFGPHSVLSPLINIGFLTPKDVITYVESYYKKHKTTVKFQSVEGFVRQLFWREYCAFVYIYKEKEFYKNTFDHKNKLAPDWYTGNTKFEFINDIIKKCLKYGYAHHIERLMYVGNIMLLTEINPKYVYKWFMEMFIDAYPWVMVPNVYGMSQYAGGSLMTKRPYFCSSNYIHKMSSYKKKAGVYDQIILKGEAYEWYEVLDALFYNFIENNKAMLKKNYSIAGIVSFWNKKTKLEKNQIINIAESYMSKY